MADVSPSEHLKKGERYLREFALVADKGTPVSDVSGYEADLNSKISLSLLAFEALNQAIQDSSPEAFESFEELRGSIISVLNEIVQNYTPKNARRAEKQERSARTPEAFSPSPRRPEKTTYQRSQSPKKPATPKPEPKELEPRSAPQPQVQSQSMPNGLLKLGNFKDFNQVMSQVSFRSLSARQAKEIMDELFTAKAVFDQKCMEQSKEKETMEQFMYHYFKQQYGLNTTVIEWVLAIIEAIKNYSRKDNDVATFGYVDSSDPSQRNRRRVPRNPNANQRIP